MLELSTPSDDGLEIMTVGPWACNKHHFLKRYIDAFTVAMKDKGWSGLHYIDLFAGPGLLRVEDTNELEWGSPLIAAHCDLFDAIHLCELNPKYFEALKVRVNRLRPDVSPKHGDANEEVHQILQDIPDGALSLAFLDPFGLQLHLETVRVLSRKRIDLVLFFPDYLDILRNWQSVYRDQPESKLDMFLGDGVDWRSALDRAGEDQRAEVFRKLYVEQMKQLGYMEFEVERISARGPIYLLMFFSRHSAGAKIWRGISGTKPDGQRTMDFG